MEHAMYAQGQPIKINYRCNGDPGTAAPVCDVMDDSGAVISTLTPGSGLTQSAAVGTESIFEASFTPNTQGAWRINARDAHGGNYVKTFPVGLHGMQWLIGKIIEMDGQLDTIEAAVGAISVVDGKVDTVLTQVAQVLVDVAAVGVKADTLLVDVAAVKAQTQSIEDKVDTLGSGGAHIG